jgi:Fe2+ transport system protein B
VAIPAVAQPAAQTTSIETSPVQTVATENTVSAETAADDDYFVQPMEEIIAERNAYLKERDMEYLESFKASQDKKLELMRERLARQEQRIKEMESRYQEIYDIRAADMKEMQERRESFLTDRI